jgi:hypothetical protein
MADESTESIQYDDDCLRYFAQQLRKSGRFDVNEFQTSTPVRSQGARQKTYSVTPTPVREYIRESLGTYVPRKTAPSEDQPRSSLPEPQSKTPYVPRASALPTSPFLGGRVDYLSSRIPELPKFSGDEKGAGNVFEVWKYDVNCLIDEGMYPLHTIREAIRKSLKGTARGVLLHLGEYASILDILTELEGIYGNVQSSEKLKEQFYNECQKPDESVAEYSLRLERLLSRVPDLIDRGVREEMLKNRLWSGLRDPALRNVSRYLFQKEINYNTLRKQLRAIEEDLKSSVSSSSKNVIDMNPGTLVNAPVSSTGIPVNQDSKAGVAEAKQFVSNVESRVLKQLEIMTAQMTRMETKLGSLEKDIQELRRTKADKVDDRGGSWRGKGNNFRADEPAKKEGKVEDLNSKGPPSQGR